MKDLYHRFNVCRSDADASLMIWTEMMLLLMFCNKCRLVNDYKTRFNLPPYKIRYEKLEQMWEHLLIKHGLSIPRSPKDLQDAKRSFTDLLRERKDECFSPLRYILHNGKTTDVTNIFNYLRESLPLMKTHTEALSYFYKKMPHGEKPIYLYHAILYLLHLERLDAKEEIPVIDGILSELKPGDIVAMAEEHDRSKVGFLDDVFDKHTNKNSGKTSLDFALEGAKVANEDIRFLNPLYRKFYIDFDQVASGCH